jgi:hypothetical protein
VEVTTSDVEGGREHRCISCLQVDEGPNATCDCMTPGPPCGICGEPQYDPITPWKSNGHWAEDGHEWEPAAPSSVPEIKEEGEACGAEAGANHATDYELWTCELPRGHLGAHISFEIGGGEWTDATTRYESPAPRTNREGDQE